MRAHRIQLSASCFHPSLRATGIPRVLSIAGTLRTSEDSPKRRALIVEDDVAIRELVRLHLSLAGFDVTELGDGNRALEVGCSTRFDLIVLDLMLPGIDGITLCRAFRDQGGNVATPILMLTARDSESDKVLGLESGADDYLTKPFEPAGFAFERCEVSFSLDSELVTPTGDPTNGYAASFTIGIAL